VSRGAGHTLASAPEGGTGDHVRCARLASTLLVLALLAPPAVAQGNAETLVVPRPLTVGVVERAPYAVSHDGAAWQGMGIDFWRVLAEVGEVDYRLVALGGTDPIDALADGTVDVVLPVAATAAVEEVAMILPPFYTATMGVAHPQGQGLLRTARNLFSWDFFRIVLAISALLLVVGFAMWLLERRRNGAQFSTRPLAGMGDGFWWAGVTLTTIGYGDKTPITLWGRAVAMLWMLSGLGISAALTASVVAATDIGPTSGDFSLLRDLSGRTVAVVEGSSTEAWLAGSGIATRAESDLAAALRSVEAGDADAAAANSPALNAAVDRQSRFHVSATTADPVYFAVALSDRVDPTRAESLRRAARGYLLTDGWWQTVARYVE
jgi:ABC-type amino acid transport substrate-binding protein